MNKNDIEKTAGISGAVALLITILCNLFHSGVNP